MQGVAGVDRTHGPCLYRTDAWTDSRFRVIMYAMFAERVLCGADGCLGSGVVVSCHRYLNFGCVRFSLADTVHCNVNITRSRNVVTFPVTKQLHGLKSDHSSDPAWL